jgi:hypothetical protein
VSATPEQFRPPRAAAHHAHSDAARFVAGALEALHREERRREREQQSHGQGYDFF